MGHCCSCYELRATDTNIAAEILTNADEYGTVVPTNIAPGLFLQLAADNTDVNEETLDGKKHNSCDIYGCRMTVWTRTTTSPTGQPQWQETIPTNR